jgi:formylglycine-generating enzyme required for sulfatase activity
VRLSLGFVLLLAGPLAADPAGELADRVIGVVPVAPADDVNADGAVDAADVANVVGDPVPLVITSTAPADAITDQAVQTLTFTFAQPVHSFDWDDVRIEGGTKCEFRALSATEYTLAVTATGGDLRIQVSRGAALADDDGRPSALARFGNTVRDGRVVTLPGGVTMELIRILPGTFPMGSPRTEPSRGEEQLHTVTLTRPFYMGRHEVTQAQWLAVMGFWPGQAFNQAPSEAFGLCWDDAVAFVGALNAHIANSGQEPLQVRLPTEAEWEYACRADTTTRFSFGDGLGTDDFCSTTDERTAGMWYCGNNSPAGAKPVGQKPANAFGLYDMHGNVFEWVADHFGPYSDAPQTDPTGPATGGDRVIRSGSWQAGARFCRSAYRGFSSPGGASRFRDQGFRVAADAVARTPEPAFVTLTSTHPDGAVGTVPVQTVTIAFDQCVNGFTIDDVFVTGAAKEELVATSARSYLLVLRAPGGRVSVRVPADVVQTSAGLGNQPSAVLANFHQDLWTVALPGGRTMDLIRVPAGTFQMGAPDTEAGFQADETLHQVTISEDFYLGRTEVTQAQWLSLQTLPGTQLLFLDDAPVQSASYNDATAWVAALNASLAGSGTFALPTEAQWEYACRAGTSTRFSFGDATDINRNCADWLGSNPYEPYLWYQCVTDGVPGASRVAQKLPNAWGLYDMHGNMMEYVWDLYAAYPPGPVVDPLNTVGTSPVLRGGYYDGEGLLCRSADRYDPAFGPTTRAFFFGFRIVGRKP